jgi:outer membrane protein insertion porin family
MGVIPNARATAAISEAMPRPLSLALGLPMLGLLALLTPQAAAARSEPAAEVAQAAETAPSAPDQTPTEPEPAAPETTSPEAVPPETTAPTPEEEATEDPATSQPESLESDQAPAEAPATPLPSGPPGSISPGSLAPEKPDEPRVLVSEVVIQGLEGHPERERLELAAYDAMVVRPGSRVTRSELQTDLSAIYATGWFSDVRIQPVDGPLGVQVVVITTPNPVLEKRWCRTPSRPILAGPSISRPCRTG